MMLSGFRLSTDNRKIKKVVNMEGKEEDLVVVKVVADLVMVSILMIEKIVQITCFLVIKLRRREVLLKWQLTPLKGKNCHLELTHLYLISLSQMRPTHHHLCFHIRKSKNGKR